MIKPKLNNKLSYIWSIMKYLDFLFWSKILFTYTIRYPISYL